MTSRVMTVPADSDLSHRILHGIEVQMSAGLIK